MDLFAGEGEMRRLCRELDWSATSLGPVAQWTGALRTIVRTALESPFPMNLWCGVDRVLIYNDAYRHVLGAKHPDALGRPGWEVWAEIWPQIGPLFQQIEAGGPPVFAEDAPFLIERRTDERASGERTPNAWFTFSLSPIRDQAGEIVGFLNIVSETTARVLSERARTQALAEAEHANQAKSQFLANMSHEIRTPINAVVGYTDLLDADIAGTLTPRQREFVDRIRTSSQHLLGLVNDVLDLSKIEAGEMMVRTEPAAARPVVSSALQIVAAEVLARSLTLEEEWNCPGSLRFLGDEDRVRQILLNLLSNALKFTPPGGAITVRCDVVDAPAPEAALPESGPWVVLQVEDTGSGIPEDQQERIFAAFVQAESGHTRRVGGTGLGLTISRRFARLMGGDLTVRSEVGRGSCFILWLPALVQARTAARPHDRVQEYPPGPREVSPFRAVGQLLLEGAEVLEEDLVWKLRMEHGDQAAGIDRAQMADHTAAYLAGLGRAVTALDNRQDNQDLLEDGTELRGIIAQRHGAQRRRLGWKRSDIEREYQILRESLESFLQREVPRRTSLDPAAAINAVHRLLDEARATSLASYDRG